MISRFNFALVWFNLDFLMIDCRGISSKGISNRGENWTVCTHSKSVRTPANFLHTLKKNKIARHVKFVCENLACESALWKFGLWNHLTKILQPQIHLAKILQTSLNLYLKASKPCIHFANPSAPCESLRHLATPHLKTHHLHQRPPLLNHRTSLYLIVFPYYIIRDCSLFWCFINWD